MSKKKAIRLIIRRVYKLILFSRLFIFALCCDCVCVCKTIVSDLFFWLLVFCVIKVLHSDDEKPKSFRCT